MFSTEFVVPQTGDIVTEIMPEDRGHWVYKCGSITGTTRGKLDMDGEINIKTTNMHGDCGDRVFTLYNQYTIFNREQIFRPGDSGAAVYIESNGAYRLLGILVGGDKSGRRYYVSPMTAVLHAFEGNLAIKNFSTEQPMDLN